MSLIIYTNKDDTYLEKIKEYAEYNSWSLSKAVRQILKAFVKVNMPETPKWKGQENITIVDNYPMRNEWLPPETIISNVTPVDSKEVSGGYIFIDEDELARAKAIKKTELDDPYKQYKEDKIDLATFEANQMAKLNTNQKLEDCIKEKTVNGKVSCYFFDNGREHYPFCKSECWTNKNIWGKRVRL